MPILSINQSMIALNSLVSINLTVLRKNKINQFNNIASGLLLIIYECKW